ncbi:hypothetical protein CHARACLAT_027747 [Characodon lateralis]|uniref:Uncharacterized protein n=1 Tax=Characodon lateralis TaxID=208331 RepID=A0ABU7EG98_9TELE|nr:hypothetical protein [Characodon lateralis]
MYNKKGLQEAEHHQDEEGKISLRISCMTVTASSIVTLKPTFSPPVSGMRKENISRHKRKSIGSKKLTI